jgi:hypothetical protein
MQIKDLQRIIMKDLGMSEAEMDDHCFKTRVIFDSVGESYLEDPLEGIPTEDTFRELAVDYEAAKILVRIEVDTAKIAYQKIIAKGKLSEEEMAELRTHILTSLKEENGQS